MYNTQLQFSLFPVALLSCRQDKPGRLCTMVHRNAFFIQYQVTQDHQDRAKESIPNGIATIIVFADSPETARARAGKFMGKHHFQITGFLRILLIQRSSIETADHLLKKLYQKAEQYGIAFHCDLLFRNPSHRQSKGNNRTK